MEKETSNHHKGQSTTHTQKHCRRAAGGEIREDQTTIREPEKWKALESNFRQVQSVLDWNRVLIEQVNANHQSRTHRNLVENVSLIQEINGNISKVVSLYSGFSSDLTRCFAGTKPPAEIRTAPRKLETEIFPSVPFHQYCFL